MQKTKAWKTIVTPTSNSMMTMGTVSHINTIRQLQMQSAPASYLLWKAPAKQMSQREWLKNGVGLEVSSGCEQYQGTNVGSSTMEILHSTTEHESNTVELPQSDIVHCEQTTGRH